MIDLDEIEKARRWWLWSPGGHWQVDFDGPPNYTKDAFAKIIEVKEVTPSSEKLVECLKEMKAALEKISDDTQYKSIDKLYLIHSIEAYRLEARSVLEKWFGGMG